MNHTCEGHESCLRLVRFIGRLVSRKIYFSAIVKSTATLSSVHTSNDTPLLHPLSDLCRRIFATERIPREGGARGFVSRYLGSAKYTATILLASKHHEWLSWCFSLLASFFPNHHRSFLFLLSSTRRDLSILKRSISLLLGWIRYAPSKLADNSRR